MGSERWQSSSEKEVRKIGQLSSPHCVLGQPRHTVGEICPKRCHNKQGVEAFKKKHPDKLSQGMILLHDNARPHKALLITFLLNDSCWDMFRNIAHLTNFTPSDYYLFANLYRCPTQKWKQRSTNWTKIFTILAFQSYLTTMKNVLLFSVTM